MLTRWCQRQYGLRRLARAAIMGMRTVKDVNEARALIIRQRPVLLVFLTIDRRLLANSNPKMSPIRVTIRPFLSYCAVIDQPLETAAFPHGTYGDHTSDGAANNPCRLDDANRSLFLGYGFT